MTWSYDSATQTHTHNLGLIVVKAVPSGDNWTLEASHGTPPGEFLDESSAKIAADRFARAQLEKTLAEITRIESEPGSASVRPRPCGLVVFRALPDRAASIAEARKAVMTALGLCA